MMSAPPARTSAGFTALTVAAVPTGMKAGVLISPRRIAIVPTRARPSVAAMVKEKRGTMAFLMGRSGRPEDSEAHEFGRAHRRDPDLGDQPAAVDVVLGHRRSVAADVEGFVLGRPHQRAVAPHPSQEQPYAIVDPRPQPLAVRLERGPRRAVLDRALEEQEQAAHADIFPQRVAGEGAGAPEPDAAVREAPDQIDAARVEQPLNRRVDLVLHAERADQDLVGGRLPDAALEIDAAI